MLLLPEAFAPMRTVSGPRVSVASWKLLNRLSCRLFDHGTRSGEIMEARLSGLVFNPRPREYEKNHQAGFSQPARHDAPRGRNSRSLPSGELAVRRPIRYPQDLADPMCVARPGEEPPARLREPARPGSHRGTPDPHRRRFDTTIRPPGASLLIANIARFRHRLLIAAVVRLSGSERGDTLPVPA